MILHRGFFLQQLCLGLLPLERCDVLMSLRSLCRPPVGKPEDGGADRADTQQLNGRRDVPTAAEKGEAFFQVRIVDVHANT